MDLQSILKAEYVDEDEDVDNDGEDVREPTLHLKNDITLTLDQMISVFRADPFAVNAGSTNTISETFINGQHGPLLYPPLIFEFPVFDSSWVDRSRALAMQSFPPKRKAPALTPPRKRIRTSQNSPPTTLSAFRSSSFLLSSTPTPPTTTTANPFHTLPFPSTQGPLVEPLVGAPFEQRPWFKVSDYSSSLASFTPRPPERWIPSSLCGRNKDWQLKFHSSSVVNPRENHITSLPPLLALFSSSVRFGRLTIDNDNEPGSEWPYHPCEWQGLPGPKLVEASLAEASLAELY